VKQLLEHPAFDIKSPNQVRVLIGNFCTNNLTNFHHIDGSGYCLLIDQIITLDDINPQMASSLLARSLMINWRRYDITRQQLIESQLQRLLKLPNLSTEVFEVVNKCL
jgi:aminopeptidase N